MPHFPDGFNSASGQSLKKNAWTTQLCLVRIPGPPQRNYVSRVTALWASQRNMQRPRAASIPRKPFRCELKTAFLRHRRRGTLAMLARRNVPTERRRDRRQAPIRGKSLRTRRHRTTAKGLELPPIPAPPPTAGHLPQRPRFRARSTSA